MELYEKIIFTCFATLAFWGWLTWFSCQNEYARQCVANFKQCQEDFINYKK